MTTLETDRREFLKRTAQGSVALILGFYLPVRGSGQDIADRRTFRPTPNNQITVLTEIPEMGQGPRTVDTMILADELEADWSTIRVEQAPVIPQVYRNLHPGGSGGTGSAWGYMRKVGAQARELLLISSRQSEVGFLLDNHVSTLAVANVENAQPLPVPWRGIAAHALVVYARIDPALIYAAS